jgi:hypothetical protein
VQPSFAVAVAAGYTFGAGNGGATHFRLGAILSFTSLNDQAQASKETMTAVLLDPSLRVRLLAERLYLGADLGIGFLSISGIKAKSSLLQSMATQTLLVSNAPQGLFELRPALTLEYRLHPAVALFAGPAIEYSPKKTYFYAALTRIELLAGITFRL